MCVVSCCEGVSASSFESTQVWHVLTFAAPLLSSIHLDAPQNLIPDVVWADVILHSQSSKFHLASPGEIIFCVI